MTGEKSYQKLQCLYGNIMANNFLQNCILDNGLFQKISTPPTDGILEVRVEKGGGGGGGGVKDSGNPGGSGGGGELNLKKSILQGSFWPIVHAIRTFS